MASSLESGPVVIRKEVSAMDGSSAALIVIPIIVSLGLAAWLGLVLYAASHPRWTKDAKTTRPRNQTVVRQPREGEPRPADLTAAEAGHNATPAKPAKLAA